MAPSIQNGKPRQNAKKGLTKPVLPALPIFAKASKVKPVSAPAALSEPSVEEPSHDDRLGSSGNIEVADATSETGTENDHAQSLPEALMGNETEAQTSDLPQELKANSPPAELDERNSSGPIPDSGDANTQPADTDISSSRDGATQSNVSLVSAEDLAHSSMSVQDNVDQSEHGLDGITHISQPVVFEHVQSTPHNGYVNGSASTTAPEFRTGPSTDSYESGAEAVNHERKIPHSRTPEALPNGSRPEIQPGSRSQQYSVPTDPHRSSSGSLAISQFPSISEHLQQLAASKLWADWVLTIHMSGLQPFAAYAHGILLMRSTRLTSLMDRQGASQYSGNIINLHPPRVLSPHAFEAALGFFYTDTVLSSDALFPKQPAADIRAMRISLLDYLISYWVSGIELGIEPIVSRSAHVLLEYIDWDISEIVMKEAIELDSISWRAGDQRAGVALDYAAMALQLKQTVLNFLAPKLKLADFKLDLSGSMSIIKSRFSQIEDSRARHNPALASMVFGSMPSSADLSPSSPQSEILPMIASSEEQVASHILLNVDFDDLAFFHRQLGALHGTAAAQLIIKIVDERESRRLRVVSNKGVPNKQRMMNSEMWDVAGYREYLEDGFLRRERVGFLLPTTKTQ